jgi:hypothetical protein
MMDHARSRKAIINIFEGTCLFGVQFVAVVGVIFVLWSFSQQDGNPILAAVIAFAAFIATCIVFGGALTLLDIARSLERLVALASKREMRSGADEPPDLEPA